MLPKFLVKFLLSADGFRWSIIVIAFSFVVWQSTPDPSAPAVCLDYVVSKHQSDTHNVILILATVVVGYLVFVGGIVCNAVVKALRQEGQDGP